MRQFHRTARLARASLRALLGGAIALAGLAASPACVSAARRQGRDHSQALVRVLPSRRAGPKDR
jgi:hypothetical protein